MSDWSKQFQRKVDIRKEAIENSWRGGNIQAGQAEHESEEQRRWRELEEALTAADALKFNDGYWPLTSHRKVIGPAIVFCKRAVRKLIKIFFGWYLFPIYTQRNRFNEKLISAVTLEREILHSVDARLNELVKTAGTLAEAKKEVHQMAERIRRMENLPTEDEEFYHEFEERFRGSRDEIRGRLQIYVPYIKERLPDWSKGRFIDVGSGRGEWLDVLRDNGAADYIGVDLNARQNAVAEGFGHKTVCEDCIQYLARQPDESVDLISGFQIIEHLYVSDLVELLRQSHRVLKKGGMILLETPNPKKLIVGANTFYMDMSHKWPLDPAVMEFIVKWIGFADMKTIEANPLPRWDGLSLENWDEKQLDDIKKINDIFWLIYGPGDYALFAVKE